MRYCLVAILALAILPLQAADQKEADFERGNQLYRERKYEAAAEHFQKVLTSGFSNALVEFNLGNASYRQGMIGLARLHYERAARLAPNDPDIRTNISFIENRYLKQTLREENFATVDRVLWLAVSGFPSNETLAIGITAYLALNLLIGIRLLSSRALHPALFWSILIVLFLVAVVPIAISVAQVTLAESSTYGIVVAKDVGVASEPEADAPSSFPAPEAMKVIIGRRQEDWVEIVLPNGSKGWVHQGVVEVI